MKRPSRLATALLLAVALLVSSCASPAASPGAQGRSDVPAKPATPKRIVAALRGAPPSMANEKTHPQGLVGSVPGLDALYELLHAGLVRPNHENTLLPQLAEQVPSLENGRWKLFPDGRMETSLRLKQNARWHDGTPMTTADLLFTALVEQDKEVGIPRPAIYDLIDRIDAVDDRSITVAWKQPYIEADLMFSYAFALPLPKHLLEKPYLEDRASLVTIPYWTTEWIGAGPFKLKEWVLDSYVVLESFADYALGRPKIDEIQLKFIPDPNTLAANVLAGVELTLGRALGLEQGMQIRDQWKDGRFELVYRSWVPINVQFMNPNPTIVTDYRFRRAMLQAIDRQQLVESIMAGQVSIAHSFVSPQTDEFKAVEPSVVRYEFEPRVAAEAIQALGYRRGADGMFLDGTGQKLGVELRTTIQNAIHTPTTAAVADYWQQVGVTVEQNIVPVQRAQDREYRAQYPAFELINTGAGLGSRDVRRFHSSSISTAENRFTVSGNNSRYSNPQLDSAIDRYVSTIPRGERSQALAQVVHHQTENLSIMGLIFAAEPTMIANRLRNVTRRGDQATEAWNAQEWDLAS